MENKYIKMYGAEIIWGIPEGIEPDKKYTVTFTKDKVMDISDEHTHFTLFKNNDGHWETSLKEKK